MNKELKQLLLKLAHLPKSDQQWVLKQLSAKQQAQFKELQGDILLKKANRFRKLVCPEITEKKPQLPEMCQSLKHQDPLYIAIILDQGNFAWEHEFLQMCTQKDEIKQLLNQQVNALKPATKLYLLQEWQSQLSFQDQLEAGHG